VRNTIIPIWIIAENFTIGPGVVGLAMARGPEDLAAISEIWFVYKNNLYQFSSSGGGSKELLPTAAVHAIRHSTAP
jgi:hypothetical protein